MKVLHVITEGDLGGAQRHVADIVEGLPDIEHSIAVGTDGWLTSHAAGAGVSVNLVGGLTRELGLKADIKALREIRSLYRSLRPDIVHLHSSKAGILGRWAAVGTVTPTIFTAHGWAFAQGVSGGRRAYAIAAEAVTARAARCDHIITVSEADRRLALRLRIAPPRRITTVHNGIADIEPPSKMPTQTFTVGMTARFSEQKDQATLIRAAAAMSQPLKLVFIGDGPRRQECQNLADRLEVDAVFRGAVDDAHKLLGEMDVFALISNWEGLPISILEAMRAGVAVVASDVGGVAEAIVHEETGFVVPGGDATSLARCLEELATDARHRHSMGEAGRRRYESNFTLGRMAAEVESVYRQVEAT